MKGKAIINFVAVSLVSFWMSYVYWINSNQVNEYLSLSLYRPFVYRQLAPMLARSLMWFGVPANWSIVLVMTAAGICFYYALRALVYQFYGDKNVPMPKINDMMMTLYQLGFQSVEIIANIQETDIKAYTKDGIWIHNQNSSIENAMLGLIEVAKAYNSFDEKTKQEIKQSQEQEASLP